MNMYSQLLARKKEFFLGMAWERAVTRIILLLFAYSIVVAYVGKDSQPALLQLANNGQEYNGILFKTPGGYDFYDLSPLNFNPKTTDITNESATIAKNFDVVSIADEELIDPKTNKPNPKLTFDILSAGVLLANDGSYARIYDTSDKRTYDLMREDGNMDAVTFTGRKDILSVGTDENGGLALHYFFANCREPEVFPLKENDRPAKRTLEALDIPAQNEILLSPSQIYAAIIDHNHASKIRVMNLISQQVTTLNVPGMSESQIHYAPSFMGDDLIAFSVLDGDATSTELYSIKSGVMSQISTNFSDAIYLSRTGDVIMLQSFTSLAGNVPYGSHAWIRKKSVIKRDVVEGSIRDVDTVWKRAFVDPLAENLTFKPDAKDVFPAIRNPETRRIIQQFWSSLNDPSLPKDVEMKIVRWENDQISVEDSIPYTVNAEVPHVSWNMDMSPLLRVLGMPEELITQYNDQRVRATSSVSGQYNFMNIK